MAVDKLQKSPSSMSNQSSTPDNSVSAMEAGAVQEELLDESDSSTLESQEPRQSGILGFVKGWIPGMNATPKPRRKKVRFGLRKKNSTPVNETTPLTQASEGSNDNAMDRLLSRDPLAPHTPTRATASWKKIQQHVQSGEHLLAATATDAGTDRMSRRLQAQDAIRSNLDFSLTQCVLAICLYIGVAVVAFSVVFGDWTIVDSVYFSVVTFSTVGYGDLVPKTHAARLFTCFFALSSVACLGIAIGVVGNNIIDAQDKAVERAKELSKRRVMTLFTDRDATPMERALSSGDLDIDGDEPTAARKESDSVLFKVLREFMLVLVILAIFGAVVAQDPAINAADVFYFLIISATTCGYGDLVPTSQSGRLATAIFIPLAVGAMGHWLSIVASSIIESRQSHVRKTLGMRDLTIEDLDVMDDDGDGRVTRAEFLEFMLVAMDKIDRDLVLELREHFEGLDADGTGVLSKGDLIANARRKLQDPARKLELAKYKETLLNRAEEARQESAFWSGSPALKDLFGRKQA